jgi:hypothetical protein
LFTGGVAFAHGRLDAIMVFVCVRMRDVVGPPIFFMEELNLESLFFFGLVVLWHDGVKLK